MADATTTTTNPLSSAATGADPLVGKQIGQESSLSSWAGPYVTEMLGRGQALADMPYQAYTGPLTAAESGLQTQAFQGLAGLTVPSAIGQAAGTAGSAATQSMGLSYDPTAITTGQFTDPGVAQQYMNPYVQTALDPQLAEARRQADITRAQNAARLTQAGAFGGSRQAIMESEAQRNMLQNLANITGKGYETAYGQAQQAFTADQQRALEAQRAAEQSRQFGSTFGLQGLQSAIQGATAQGQLGSLESQTALKNLEAQLAGGAAERGIQQEGIAADYGQFREERDFPYKQVQYMQSLLQELPLATQSYSYAQPSTLSQILGSAGGVQSLYDSLFGSGSGTGTGTGTTPVPNPEIDSLYGQ